MASPVFFRDVQVRPGEDKVLCVSTIFRSLHGHIRNRDLHSQAATDIVLVAYASHQGQKRLASVSRPADGVRVFSATREGLEQISLNPRIAQAVDLGEIQEGMVDEDTSSVQVSRIRLKSSPSVLRRRERRREAQGKPADLVGTRVLSLKLAENAKRRDFFHFWNIRDGVTYPVFLAMKVQPGFQGVSRQSSYGCGVAPAIGLLA